MEPDLKKHVVKNLKDAREFIAQAQNPLHPSLTLFKELGKLADEVESLSESVEEGDFDK